MSAAPQKPLVVVVVCGLLRLAHARFAVCNKLPLHAANCCSCNFAHALIRTTSQTRRGRNGTENKMDDNDELWPEPGQTLCEFSIQQNVYTVTVVLSSLADNRQNIK